MDDVCRACLVTIDSFTRTNGYPPTLREICDANGWPSVDLPKRHSLHLKRDKLIKLREKTARSFVLTAAGKRALKEQE